MTTNKPPLTYKVTINGEEKEIKMTYGLFMEISRVIPEPQNIGELLITDPGLRDYVLRRVLTDKREIKEESDLIDPFDLDLTLDETNDIIMWVGDHILYFFTTSMAKVVSLGQKYETKLRQLSPSNNGSEDSDSKEDSVGASTV